MARGHSKRKLFTSFLGVAGEGIDKRECSKLKKASIVKLNFRCIGPVVK